MSWLDPEEVERLREVYSRDHTPIPKGSTAQVWKALQQKFGDRCRENHYRCVVGQLLSKSRAPDEWKQNKTEWLSDLDIKKVEANYMKLFKHYHFLGAVSIDFDLTNEAKQCLVDSLCAIKLDKLHKKGYYQIGIIFNTAPHDEQGEHWVAVFCDMRPSLSHPRMTYFDSYAHSPEPEIKRLMTRWQEQWLAMGISSSPMELTFNSTRHQYKNSECGMYCLYFHYACLTEIPMDKRIPDDVINSFRSLLFSNT